mmetsp:Transcript_72387/g.205491  ORF Transcript_72387/g.205491 Transcript_72387/m.205491 type:complete len:216 (+) Transcript_72387:884-1531(+)
MRGGEPRRPASPSSARAAARPRAIARRGLVQLGRVELGQVVDRDADELLGGTVGGHGAGVLGVLILPELRRLPHLPVKLPDARLESLDLLLQLPLGRRGLAEGLAEVRGLQVQGLLLVLGLVQLGLAVGLLVVVRRLLLAQQRDHVVDHLDDLVEGAIRAALQGQRHQLEAGAPPATARQGGQRLALGLLAADLRLQQRGAWQRLLEKLQRVVVI